MKDRGARGAANHGVAKSWLCLSNWTTTAHTVTLQQGGPRFSDTGWCSFLGAVRMQLGDQLPASVTEEAPPGAGPSSVALTARLQGGGSDVWDVESH